MFELPLPIDRSEEEKQLGEKLVNLVLDSILKSTVATDPELRATLASLGIALSDEVPVAAATLDTVYVNPHVVAALYKRLIEKKLAKEGRAPPELSYSDAAAILDSILRGRPTPKLATIAPEKGGEAGLFNAGKEALAELERFMRALLLHEALHVYLIHPARGEALIKMLYPGGLDPETLSKVMATLNIAADAVVDRLLRAKGLSNQLIADILSEAFDAALAAVNYPDMLDFLEKEKGIKRNIAKRLGFEEIAEILLDELEAMTRPPVKDLIDAIKAYAEAAEALGDREAAEKLREAAEAIEKEVSKDWGKQAREVAEKLREAAAEAKDAKTAEELEKLARALERASLPGDVSRTLEKARRLLAREAGEEELSKIIDEAKRAFESGDLKGLEKAAEKLGERLGPEALRGAEEALKRAKEKLGELRDLGDRLSRYARKVGDKDLETIAEDIKAAAEAGDARKLAENLEDARDALARRGDKEAEDLKKALDEAAEKLGEAYEDAARALSEMMKKAGGALAEAARSRLGEKTAEAVERVAEAEAGAEESLERLARSLDRALREAAQAARDLARTARDLLQETARRELESLRGDAEAWKKLARELRRMREPKAAEAAEKVARKLSEPTNNPLETLEEIREAAEEALSKLIEKTGVDEKLPKPDEVLEELAREALDAAEKLPEELKPEIAEGLREAGKAPEAARRGDYEEAIKRLARASAAAEMGAARLTHEARKSNRDLFDALDKLREAQKRLAEGEPEEAKRRLEEAAEKLEREAPEQARRLREAAKELEKATPSSINKAARDMSDVAKEIEKLIEKLPGMPCAKRLARLSQRLREAATSLAQQADADNIARETANAIKEAAEKLPEDQAREANKIADALQKTPATPKSLNEAAEALKKLASRAEPHLSRALREAANILKQAAEQAGRAAVSRAAAAEKRIPGPGVRPPLSPPTGGVPKLSQAAEKAARSLAKTGAPTPRHGGAEPLDLLRRILGSSPGKASRLLSRPGAPGPAGTRGQSGTPVRAQGQPLAPSRGGAGTPSPQASPGSPRGSGLPAGPGEHGEQRVFDIGELVEKVIRDIPRVSDKIRGKYVKLPSKEMIRRAEEIKNKLYRGRVEKLYRELQEEAARRARELAEKIQREKMRREITREMMKRYLEREVKWEEKEAGAGQGGMERLLARALVDVRDIEKYLKRLFYREFGEKRIMAFTRRHPALRTPPGPVYYSEAPRKIVAMIDTSGSIGVGELAKAVKAIREISKNLGSEAEIVYWDYGVEAWEKYSPTRVSRMERFTRPVGGGGTYLSPAVIEVMRRSKLSPYDTAVVIISDFVLGDSPEEIKRLLERLSKKSRLLLIGTTREAAELARNIAPRRAKIFYINEAPQVGV